MPSRVYLDHAATTPLADGVADAMRDVFENNFGNPSGAHAEARAARLVIEDARDSIANDLGVKPSEVVFTGGATEANNFFVRGVREALGDRIICSAIEHESVLKPVTRLMGRDFGVTSEGEVDLESLRNAFSEEVSAVSVMAVNNETGMVQPMREIVQTVKAVSPKTIIHSDAVQAAPWLDVKESLDDIDSFSISAHKFGGPKGVGVLVIRTGLKLTSQMLGGGQEQDRRSGTQNVAGIVGMAAALRKCAENRQETSSHVGELRDQLVARITNKVDASYETGNRDHKIPNNAHVVIPGVESEALIFALDEAGVAASASSACASGAMQPSHVLLAMGYSREDAKASLRLTLGPTTTSDDIDFAIRTIAEVVTKLRDN